MGHVELLLMAAIAAVIGVRQGHHDARGRQPPAVRGRLAQQVMLPFLAAAVLVSILRYLTLHRLGPPSAMVFAALAISVPFMVTRALSNRAVTHTSIKST
jgi:uncharacterized membrane protein